MRGLIHIYTGNGKGKTTASIGLAVRAAGCGKKVVFVQFFKGRDCGELHSFEELPNVTVIRHNSSHGFYKNMSDEEKELVINAAQSGYDLFNEKGAEQDVQYIKELEEKGMTVIPADQIDIEAFKGKIIEQVLEKFKDSWAEGGWEVIQGL